MRQLPLDFGVAAAQSLDTFEPGRNAELAQLMRRFAARTSVERFVYLWGATNAGKSHLLQALAASEASRCIDCATCDDEAVFAYTREISLYLLDDCEKLSPDQQIAAFGLYNQIRAEGGFLVASAAMPPAILPVREDLRTRMGWGLVYQVHGLTDEEKIVALTQAAHSRGLTLSASVLPYLITHFQRDMRSLSGMLDSLDRYSLETKRPITLALLRDLLQLDEKPKE